jgi:methionyl-tRNA synthetase
VPPAGEAASADHPLALLAGQTATATIEALAQLDFRSAAEAILQLASVANGYLNDRAPWSRMKLGDQHELVAADLYAVLEACRWIGVLLTPLLPDLAARLQAQLGLSPLDGSHRAQVSWRSRMVWAGLPAGQALPEPEPVMRRLELEAPL